MKPIFSGTYEPHDCNGQAMSLDASSYARETIPASRVCRHCGVEVKLVSVQTITGTQYLGPVEEIIRK